MKMVEEREKEIQDISCKVGFLHGVISLTMFIGIVLIPSFLTGAITMKLGKIPVVPDYIIFLPKLIPFTVVAGFIVATICDFLKGKSKLKTVFLVILAFFLVLLLVEGFILVYLVGNGVRF